MKALSLTFLVLCGAVGFVVAQKKSTFVGDLVIGELTGKDEATREITIKYPAIEGTEIFTGILADDSRLKMGERGVRDLMLSEILPGMYIRVFYKTRRETVSGQEKRINKITRLEVLGEDQFFRIRNQLNLRPSVVIEYAENGSTLPARSPLKIYPDIAYPNVHQDLVAWIDKWNQKKGDSYGKLEIVHDLYQADALIVIAPGADTMVAVLPMMASDGSGAIQGVLYQATSYLILKDAGRLKVLWTKVVPVLSTSNLADVSPKTFEVVMAELEKRMKARTRNSRK
jgi:hypothetical protein